jgi:nucleoside-diphosphate-sugar epimerase
MRLFITGAGGTIGSYVLAELLAAGHDVIAYSRNTPPRLEGATVVAGDIMDLDRLSQSSRGCDGIVHLAAVPGPRRTSTEQLMSINVVGTVHVLEAALRNRIRKVVFASTGAAVGFTFSFNQVTPRYFPIDEEHPSEPQDDYGLSKLLGEITCKRYSDAYGTQTICLRINNNWYVDREGAERAVRGGWAKGLTVEELWATRYRRTIEDAEKDWPVPGPPSPKNNLWAVTDARDAALAFRLAVENDRIRHETFFINGDDTCSLVTTRELLARHYPGVPLRQPLDGHASLVSHAKATRLLGFVPRYTWRRSDFSAWLQQVAGINAIRTPARTLSPCQE